MALLIDAYNVTRSPLPPSLAGLDEGRLCLLVARALAHRLFTKPAVIVCDGAPKRGSPAASPVPEVELVYVGRGVQADGEIIRRINADTAPRRLVVVSSDHEIQRAAHRRGATAWAADRFVHELALFLHAEARKQPPGVEPGGRPAVRPLNEDEVERWARQLGVDPQAPVDPEEPTWEEE